MTMNVDEEIKELETQLKEKKKLKKALESFDKTVYESILKQYGFNIGYESDTVGNESYMVKYGENELFFVYVELTPGGFSNLIVTDTCTDGEYFYKEFDLIHTPDALDSFMHHFNDNFKLKHFSVSYKDENFPLTITGVAYSETHFCNLVNDFYFNEEDIKEVNQ